jgi:hypothetical protein
VPHDWQPTNAHDDRAQVTKAREAAEALFTPKKQADHTAAPTPDPVSRSLVEQPVPRIPRIIAIPATMPVSDETVAPPSGPRLTSRREVSRARIEVPVAQHDRVRTLAQYGMTLAEVADLYRVHVEVIERIVAERRDDHSSGIT